LPGQASYPPTRAPTRSHGGPASKKLRPGSDPSQAIAELYAVGRKIYGRNPDARRDERTPQYRTTPTPSRDAATYDLGKNSPMEPAPNEYGPQFRDDKKSDRVDTKEAWCRGMAKEQHPFFDHGGSGSRYSGSGRK
jgi:hypothetical protein